MGRCVLKQTNTRGECAAGCADGFCVFDFGDERGAYYSRIGEAAEDGDVAGEGDAEAYGDGELRDGPRAAN